MITPDRLIDRLPDIVKQAIQEKREFLEEEFGDSSDFGIRGVVAGTRRFSLSSDRLSLWIISTSPGYDVDFVETLRGMTEDRVTYIGTIIMGKGRRKFTERDWQKYCKKGDADGYYTTNYSHRIILVE